MDVGCGLVLGTAYAGQIEGIKEAENVALLYMKAYFSVNMEKAAGLTHPETINAFYDTFTQELEKAIQHGSEKEFFGSGWIKDQQFKAEIYESSRSLCLCDCVQQPACS